MLNPGNIHYEISDRNHGVLYGGMGAVQMLVKRLGLDGLSTAVFIFSSCIILILSLTMSSILPITFSAMANALKI
jgi:hypothetical protein